VKSDRDHDTSDFEPNLFLFKLKKNLYDVTSAKNTYQEVSGKIFTDQTKNYYELR